MHFIIHLKYQFENVIMITHNLFMSPPFPGKFPGQVREQLPTYWLESSSKAKIFIPLKKSNGIEYQCSCQKITIQVTRLIIEMAQKSIWHCYPWKCSHQWVTVPRFEMMPFVPTRCLKQEYCIDIVRI